MTRKKVKLAFIANDASRKATFKKRKKGLMKKVSELTTLCGIQACAIIYSPYESRPEVWPNVLGAQQVVAKFKTMPEMEQSKKMVNQEGFIRQRIGKASEQLKKLAKENREKEMTEVMFRCLTGSGLQNLMAADLNDLGWLIDRNLKEIGRRIDDLRKNGPGSGSSGTMAAAATMVEAVEQKPEMDQFAVDVMTQRPPWLTEWMNNPIENLGFGHGDETMMMMMNNMPFGDNLNPMWSSSFFP